MASIDDLVAQVRAHTASSTAVLPDATIAEFVNAKVRDLQRQHRFRGFGIVVSVDVPIPTTSGGMVALPADFVEETGVWLKSGSDPANLTPIRKTLRRFFIEAVDPTTTQLDTVFPNVAAPSSTLPSGIFYYLFGGFLFIVPKPNVALTVTLDYIALLPDLLVGMAPPQTNVLSNLFPDVLRWGGLHEAYLYLHEWEVAASMLQQFEAALQRAIRFDEAQAMSGPPHQRGK